jgi:hypothetical protein
MREVNVIVRKNKKFKKKRSLWFKILNGGCKMRNSLGDEEIRKIVFSDTREQYEVFNKVESSILEWTKANNVQLSKILFVPHNLNFSEICFIYDQSVDVIEYEKNGTSERLREMLMDAFRKLDDLPVERKFRFSFESEENIKESYQGSYSRYLRS